MHGHAQPIWESGYILISKVWMQEIMQLSG